MGRRWFVRAVCVYVAYNILVSIVGLAAKLPDLPATHAHTDHISIGDVLYGNGTIMSPPLVFMVAVLLLLRGATARRLVVTRLCTTLLIVGVALTAVDEVSGFRNRPSLYSTRKWDLALTIGSIFVLCGAAVVISGTAWLTRRRGVAAGNSDI